MESTAAALQAMLTSLESKLLQISDLDTSSKPAPDKWSKKEILGHLIDSASNNQQKFVRTMLSTAALDFMGYEQDAWVSIQQYNQHPWADIVALWISINRHLAQIIKNADATVLGKTITVSGHGPFSLEFIMTDYVEHLKHHLMQIIPDAGLTSTFSMTPYV